MSCLREPNAEPIPGYRLIEPLGSGGFGEVWKCEAPGGLFKAIKFVYGNLNSLDVDGARAEQEKNALDRIREVRHPFVINNEQILTLSGELVIVMELADKNLHEMFVESQSAGLIGIPRDDLLRYMRDAAEALDYMGEKHNLAHLDVKPRNLFLVSDRVKVADFGLVKHLERSGVSGVLGGVTPLYAAPETFTNNISTTSDQYSLAIVYQELLTSQRPFNGKNARMLANQHLNESPELRPLPEAERPIVARALSKEPAKRFPSCLAFVRALYNARRAAPGEKDSRSNRPKSMADTMEDILLEQVPHDDDPAPFAPSKHRPSSSGLEEVDLGAAAEMALEEVSRLGITAALPQTGTLRPTLLIGMGSLGRRALMEVRCRFLDRFGSVTKLPLIRFLYLDTDKEALTQAQRGAPEIVLQPSEIVPLPLQPMAHYRRRQLDLLADWIPREKLYSLPRNLQTQGSRALGRLAFTDNYLRVASKVKRELQAALHPDSLYQSVTNTGLALRDDTPRVVVLASASGGASGYLADLGYTLRRILRQLRYPEARVNTFLFCGAPDDPATPATEQANLYATLTELNHYAEGVTSYSAQYGTDEPRQVEEGSPFDAIYLLTQRERTPQGRHDVLSHAGNYLYHELITPLGPHLEQGRMRAPSLNGVAAPFRTFGTHGVWFPRGLLLRLAARESLAYLLKQWARSEDDSVELSGRTPPPNPQAMTEVDAAFSRMLAEPGLQPAALTLRLEELAGRFLDNQSPPQALNQVLNLLEEQCWQYGGPDNPGVWASQSLAKVRDWLGTGMQAGFGPMTLTAGVIQRKSKLNKALENACSQLAEEWDGKLMALASGLMDLAGPRLAAAEAIYQRLVDHFTEAIRLQDASIRAQAERVAQARQKMQESLEGFAAGGGFRWFAWRPQRPLRVFLDLLATFARQCLAEDLAATLKHLYHALTARLRDRLRDLALLRQRLRQVREQLLLPAGLETDWEAGHDPSSPGGRSGEDATPTPMASLTTFWEVSRVSSTTRVVLPDGEKDLEKAAARFVSTLSGDHWVCLDQTLQEEVLASRGGLSQAAFAASDLQRQLIAPLLDRAAACLAQYLPVTDVAQVEMAQAMGDPQALALHMKASLDLAAPLTGREVRVVKNQTPVKVVKILVATGSGVMAKEVEGEKTFLLVPASDAGKSYADEAKQLLLGAQPVRVAGQADLMFCRERDSLQPEELERLLAPCREAYQTSAANPAQSPHSRFDTNDWVPLEA
jgi:serine/threonine protein kinase